MERLYRLNEGWYRNISLLLVLCTDSLNSLAEALYYEEFFLLQTDMLVWQKVQ